MLASDVTLPSFLSVVGSASLVRHILPERLHDSVVGTDDAAFLAAVSEWQARCVTPPSEPLMSATAQKAWDAPLVKASVAKLLSAAPTQAGLARLLAAASPHAGEFLQAVPSFSVGTKLDDTSLRIAIALRLGAPFWVSHTCSLSAGRPSTHQGHTVSAAASLPVVTPDTEPSVTSSSAPWRQPTSRPDLNRRRCHVMTANVRTGSAQRLGRRTAAWPDISLVHTHWLPVILTGRCLDQAPWLRRRKNESDPSAACSQRRTTLFQSPSRHWVRWETKRRISYQLCLRSLTCT